MEYARSLCTGCGRPISETFAEDGPEYVAEAWCCFACQAREQKQLEWASEEPADRAGIYYVVQERGDEP